MTTTAARSVFEELMHQRGIGFEDVAARLPEYSEEDFQAFLEGRVDEGGEWVICPFEATRALAWALKLGEVEMGRLLFACLSGRDLTEVAWVS
jgi:hypothetical protein